MEFEDYRKLKHPTPYVYKLSGKGKELLYYGSTHSADPEDPIFTDIEKKFFEFDPDIALCEGEPGPVVAKSKEEAIRSGGEVEFVGFLCSQHQIKALPACIFSDEEAESLSREFPKEEVFLYLVARVLGYRFRVGKEVTKDFLEKTYLPTRKKFWGDWGGFRFTLRNLEKAHRKVLGRELDLSEKRFWLDASNPTKDLSVLNEVARRSGDLRDEFTVNSIRDTLKSHNRIFVIMGSSHARREEPHLRKMIEG